MSRSILEKAAGRLKVKEIAGKVKKPISQVFLADFVLTERCNSRCRYCLCWKAERRREPSTEETKEVIDSLSNLGTRFINLAGGESLIRNDLEELIAYCSSKGISSVVTTNGHLASFQRVKALHEAGLTCLTWSLDTLEPKLYELIRGVPLKPTLRNLQKVLLNQDQFPNMSVGINCVLSRLNMHTIKDLIRFLTDHSSFIQLQIIHPTWYSYLDQTGEFKDMATFQKSDEEQLSQFIDDIIKMKIEGYNICNNDAYLNGFVDFAIHNRMPKDFHCLAGYDSVSINVDMKAYSCGQVGIVGDLRKENLEDLWYSKAWQTHRNKMWNVECEYCWILCHAEGVPDDYQYSRH